MNKTKLEYQEHRNKDQDRTNWGDYICMQGGYNRMHRACSCSHADVVSPQCNVASLHPVVASPHAVVATSHGDVAPSVGNFFLIKTVIFNHFFLLNLFWKGRVRPMNSVWNAFFLHISSAIWSPDPCFQERNAFKEMTPMEPMANVFGN